MKKIYIGSTLLALMLSGQSCSENYDIYPEEYAKVVMIKDAGENPLSVYSTDDKVAHKFVVMKGGHAEEAATATLRAMTSEEFTTYQAESGKPYAMLPADCYSFSADGQTTSAEIKFAPNETYKEVEVFINADALGTFMETFDGSLYSPVVPVILESSDASVNSYGTESFILPTYAIPSIGFEQNVIDYGELIGDGTITVDVPIVMPIQNQWDFDCEVVVDPSLAGNYVLASSDAYKMDVTGFVAGSNAKVTLTIDKSKLNFGIQAIPLKIRSCGFDGIEINNDLSSAIVVLNKTVARSELAELSLSSNQISGYGWATYQQADASEAFYIGYGTDFNTGYPYVIYDGGGKDALFDNNLNTFWHGDYSYGANDPTFGQYIDFELPSVANHFAYDLWTRSSNANGAPKVTDIYGSADGRNWTKLRTINSELTSGGEKFSSSVCSSPTSFKFIRFAVVQSNAGDVRSGSYWNCAEMKIYAK